MRKASEILLVSTATLGILTACGGTRETLPAPLVDTEATCRDEANHDGSNISLASDQENNTVLQERVHTVDQQLQVAWCQKAVVIGNAMLGAYNLKGEEGGITKTALGSKVTLSAKHTSEGQTDTVEATYRLDHGKTYFYSLEVTDVNPDYTDTATFNQATTNGRGPEADGAVWIMEVVRDEGGGTDPYYTYPSFLYSVGSVEELDVHAGQSVAALSDVQAVADDVMAHNK